MSRRAAVALLCCPVLVDAQTTQIHSLDLFPAFFKCWKDSDRASPDARARRFLDLVVAPHADLFDGFVGDVAMDRAVRYLAQVEPLVPIIEKLHETITNSFDGMLAGFQKSVPDFQWKGSVVFMPTLFGFDGGGGSINGKDYLVFGVDTIAKIDGLKANISVLMSHELFHIYQASLHPEWKDQTRGKSIPLYRLVWGEGLATYASEQLNPKADLAAVLRSPTLAESCLNHLGVLTRSLLQSLDSKDNAPFMEWMSGRARTSDIPPRAGYYLGWRVARELGRQHSLPELARLSDVEIRNGMLGVLQSLLDR